MKKGRLMLNNKIEINVESVFVDTDTIRYAYKGHTYYTHYKSLLD
jgi:hypothetical protein